MNGNGEYRGMIEIDQVERDAIPEFNYETQSYGRGVYVYGRAESQDSLTYGLAKSILAKLGADMKAIRWHEDDRAHGLQRVELYSHSWLNNRDTLQFAEWLRARDVPYIHVHLCKYSELHPAYVDVPDAPFDPTDAQNPGESLTQPE